MPNSFIQHPQTSRQLDSKTPIPQIINTDPNNLVIIPLLINHRLVHRLNLSLLLLISQELILSPLKNFTLPLYLITNKFLIFF
jgi:hypothetical protein